MKTSSPVLTRFPFSTSSGTRSRGTPATPGRVRTTSTYPAVGSFGESQPTSFKEPSRRRTKVGV
jgi:hypothetical protein